MGAHPTAAAAAAAPRPTLPTRRAVSLSPVVLACTAAVSVNMFPACALRAAVPVGFRPTDKQDRVTRVRSDSRTIRVPLRDARFGYGEISPIRSNRVIGTFSCFNVQERARARSRQKVFSVFYSLRSTCTDENKKTKQKTVTPCDKMSAGPVTETVSVVRFRLALSEFTDGSPWVLHGTHIIVFRRTRAYGRTARPSRFHVKRVTPATRRDRPCLSGPRLHRYPPPRRARAPVFRTRISYYYCVMCNRRGDSVSRNVTFGDRFYFFLQ